MCMLHLEQVQAKLSSKSFHYYYFLLDLYILPFILHLGNRRLREG